MSWGSKPLRLLLENVNGLAVLGGACWLYVGLAGVSAHLANIVVGGLLLIVGVFPYVLRLRKRKP